MNRIIHILLAVVLVGIAAPARSAFAQEAPTREQLEQAKQAFSEGRALYDEGKLAQAIEKFKDSYRLSRNALLLYNIGHTLDQSGDTQKALFYYRKFLADAPKDAKQRKEVAKRVEDIEKANFEAELNGTAPATTGTTGGGGAATTTVTKPAETKPPVAIKPAGTYTAADFQHAMVEGAPPGKPLDVTAFVPEDSGWTVTLYYRGSGDAKFVAKPMKWRYKELVARIPAAKVAGTFVQYYVEAKDQTDTVIARSGKSTSPNLINVDRTVAARFYPDFTDDGEPVAVNATQQRRRDNDDNPLGGGGGGRVVDDEPIGGGVGGGGGADPTTPGTGYRDVGSSKFNKAKWVSTGIAGGLIAGAVVTYILGSQQASNITADRDGRMGDVCQAPPCYAFDNYDIDVQNAGKRYNTLHTITAVTGVVAAGIAGYFWYRELTAKKRGDTRTVGRKTSSSPELVIVPSLGEGFAGAAAAARF